MSELRRYVTRSKNAASLLRILTLQFLRRLFGATIIHVIGDSHSLLFKDPLFSIDYIGPATAFRLSAKSSTNKSREKICSILDKLQEKKNTVMFVFGEIDSRIHIYKIHKKKRVELKKVIKDTVNAYVAFIEELKKDYKNLNILIFNVLPQGEQGNFYNIEYYADRATRMEITKKLNKELEKQCQEKNIPFINVFDDLVDKDGKRIKKYVFDEVHYNSDIVSIIIKKMRQQNLLQ